MRNSYFVCVNVCIDILSFIGKVHSAVYTQEIQIQLHTSR